MSFYIALIVVALSPILGILWFLTEYLLENKANAERDVSDWIRFESENGIDLSKHLLEEKDHIYKLILSEEGN